MPGTIRRCVVENHEGCHYPNGAKWSDAALPSAASNDQDTEPQSERQDSNLHRECVSGTFLNHLDTLRAGGRFW